LFPGYVFLQLTAGQRQLVLQNKYLAALLDIADQELFIRQFEEIQRALATDLEIRLAPDIGAGRQVKIKSGPLRGVEGWVEKRHGLNTVLLRLDFIGQAAAINIEASDLELV
jgi:transcription antitermination factor NusG